MRTKKIQRISFRWDAICKCLLYYERSTRKKGNPGQGAKKEKHAFTSATIQQP